MVCLKIMIRCTEKVTWRQLLCKHRDTPGGHNQILSDVHLQDVIGGD